MEKCLVLCMALLAQVSADDCPGGGACEEGNTCCKVPSDGYECCPMYQSFRMISAYAGDEDDNICPDNSHCPAEFSCLKATTGYGCCPVAHAVPCSDGKHCCPGGHQCNTDGSSCIKPKEPVVAVMCSGRESECPEGTTCCETPDGSWGCCPMPKAVCCGDKIHCCPEGSTCDIKQSKCISTTNREMPMWAKFPARKRAEWENQNEVAQVTTPIPDTTTSANRSPSFLWEGEGSSHPFIRTGDIPCDESVACQDGTTCCKTQEGGWECCPLPQAVCCSDFIHCCPHGKKCNLAALTCDDPSGSPSEPWLKKVPAVPREAKLPGDVTCDPTHICPDNTTCCKTASGDWACCPMLEAVCCEDHEHCCPHGTTCDLTTLTCDGPSGPEPMLGKVPALTTLAPYHEEAPADHQGVQMGGNEPPTDDDEDIPCDESVACQDGTTCCKTQEGGWECCPLPQAVCCSDFIHCCPHGKKCNLAALTCDDPSGSPSEPWLKKVPAVPREAKLPGDVTCDPTHICPDNTTCCKTASGDWACCPMLEAVCCEDHEHCCPHGTTCDLTTLTCDGPSGPEPMLGKVPALTTLAPYHEEAPADHQGVQMGGNEPPTDDDEDIPCDESVACQDGTTCCKTQEGGWECCPLPQAVCCSDFIHCCPHGKKCNLAALTCDDPSGSPSEPWLKKVPAVPREAKLPGDVTCDPTHICPDNTTCCKTASGDWACCPMLEAVCCEDHEHCCPHGTTCDLTTLTCDGPSGPEPMLGKVPALTTLAPYHEEAPADHQGVQMSGNEPPTDDDEDIPCDESVACQDGTTCCKTQEGGWECCPLPQAVCCSDFIHCCPHGKKCNLAALTCDDPSGSPSEPWLKKVPAVPREAKLPGDVTCDPTHICPDNTTCCKTASGDWACCPMLEAVCCEDHEHCCPHGTTCDLTTLTCDGPSGPEPMLGKVPALTTLAPYHEEAPADHQGVQMGGNEPPTDDDEDIPCDESVACQDGTTCCKTQEGGWECCPLPQAVCCSDFIHCCPHGKKCNLAALTCDDPSGSPSEPWLKKVPAVPREAKLPGDVTCDPTHICPDNTTCCKTASGDWACCPMLEAVCCEDHEHCCPHGTTCDLTTLTCDGPSGPEPMLGKVPALTTLAPYHEEAPADHQGVQMGGNEPPTDDDEDIPCDESVACQDGTTCCKTQEGGWECCPLPQAVCCSDFIHCCPHGKKCNLAALTCDDPSGSPSEPWLKKVPAVPREAKLPGDVTCDPTHICPDNTTCCKTASGDWACCPMLEAVCCEDHEHCCPHGTTCDLTTLTCDGPSGPEPMLGKVPALTTLAPYLEEAPADHQGVQMDDNEMPRDDDEGDEDEELPRTQCDDHTSCPKDATCCFMKSTQKWGCCPLPQAVCCADGEHCCPKDYICDMSKTSCSKGGVVIPWYNKLPAMPDDGGLAAPASVKCDAQNRCPEGSSCCQLSTGQWGCCPLCKAVCCADEEHCCPQGYSCNMDSGTCQKLMFLRFQTLPLTRVSAPEPPTPQEKDIHCGGVFLCNNEETCCKVSAITWGCCPSPNAVCCSDMKHCCTTGYTCGEGGTCTQSTGFNWDHWQVFFSNKKRVLRV